MEIIELKSWEEFEESFKREIDGSDFKNKQEYDHISSPLFRGQSDKDWKLQTTLERFFQSKKGFNQEFSWDTYHRILQAVERAVSSLTSNRIELPTFKHHISPIPPGYEFMIYLRHHDFPSPLLDWTKSPYVAAFFAFSGATVSTDVAIFSFREDIGLGKGGWRGEPQIEALGPYVVTHKRHYQQQCYYTICFKEDEYQKRTYCSHQDVQFGNDQDILKKYIIPYKERGKVLAKLDLMNINAFSLFGNEESLAKMLAYREMEKEISSII